MAVGTLKCCSRCADRFSEFFYFASFPGLFSVCVFAPPNIGRNLKVIFLICKSM